MEDDSYCEIYGEKFKSRWSQRKKKYIRMDRGSVAELLQNEKRSMKTVNSLKKIKFQ